LEVKRFCGSLALDDEGSTITWTKSGPPEPGDGLTPSRSLRKAKS
jgi:hypothetical protein